MRIKNITCSICNNTIPGRVYPNRTCQNCYNYTRNGGTINEIPPKGVIVKDANGRIICHKCGRAYFVLGTHVRMFHHETIDEYKEEFGLCKNAYLTESNYHTKMKDYALQYDMDEQLIRTGKDSRIKKGMKLRLGRPGREQEIIAKRRRRKKREH